MLLLLLLTMLLLLSLLLISLLLLQIFSCFFRFPGWRQGMLALAEAVSLSKPTDGWFLPNCGGSVSTLLDERNAEERRAARVVAFDQESEEEEEGLEEAEKINVLQVLIFSE